MAVYVGDTPKERWRLFRFSRNRKSLGPYAGLNFNPLLSGAELGDRFIITVEKAGKGRSSKR